MTDAKLIYTTPSDPVVAPTDILHVRAGQAGTMIECNKCGWRSQPFMFAARKAHLTLRSHFLGHVVKGKVMSWHCKRRP